MRILELLKELGACEPAEPEEPIPEEAEVVGILSEELAQLYSLIHRMCNEANALIAQLNQGMSEEELVRQINEKKKTVEILKNLFWFEVSALYGLAGERHYGVAVGWRVWKLDPAKCNCPGCSLDRAIGAIATNFRARILAIFAQDS